MNNCSNKSFILVGLMIALAIFGGGYFIGQGAEKFRTADRFVTVKGLAEKIVTSDIATLSLSIKTGDDNLSKAYDKIEVDRKKIIKFLTDSNIKAENIENGQVTVFDSLTQEYSYNNNQKKLPRYIIRSSLSVRANNIEAIKQVSSNTGQLVKQGILLDGGLIVSYKFTAINDIKSDLISEALKNARDSAEKFAKDSQSKVGSIRKANQGTIIVSDINGGYNTGASIKKKVRVVSTIIYNLVD